MVGLLLFFGLKLGLSYGIRWIYLHGSDDSSIWCYSAELGWLWSNSIVYPYLYQSQTQTCVVFEREHACSVVQFLTSLLVHLN